MLFREIGIRMGISSARAAQLYHAGVKDRAKPIPIESFTIDTPVERLPIGPRARPVGASCRAARRTHPPRPRRPGP
jgi:hypothetical protein